MLRANKTVFDMPVRVLASGEIGKVTAFMVSKRNRGAQFLVEYVAADGCYTEGWFAEDQLTTNAD